MGRESARKSSVRSYHSSLFLLKAAQGTGASSASTGMVKVCLPSSASTGAIRSLTDAAAASSALPGQT